MWRHQNRQKLDWLWLSLLIFIPRLLHLDVFLTADEPLFLEHARDFAAGVSRGDWSRTLGIGYPGVTVAWWSGPVVTGLADGLPAYAAGRFVTALATSLLLLLLYGLARPLLGRWPAFLGVGLLALDPYTLAYSRLFHIAAPLALFMTLAGVALLLRLRDGRRRWLVLGGLFTGLALLTKSTALLLGPMLGALLLGWAIGTRQWREGRWWLARGGDLVSIAAIAAVIFIILWPAMWSQPLEALTLTFGKLLTDQEAGAGNLGMFWFGQFVEDPGPAFYPVAFLLKSTPWLLLGLGLSVWQVITQQRRGDAKTPNYHLPITNNQLPLSHSPTLPLSQSLWLFALTYLLIMTLASKKSIRYMLPAFPTFYLLTGLAFYNLKEFWTKSQSPNPQSPNLQRPTSQSPNPPIPQSPNLPTLRLRSGQAPHPSTLPPFHPSTLLLPLALILTLAYHPYYLTYYNPLLLGWRWAPHTLLVGWGEGLDQAAAYLNEQPPTTVSAWYEWLFPSLLPSLYEGTVESVVPQENLLTADKAVLYINQVQRDIPGPNIIHYFRTRRQPEHTVRLAGIDYAWVYPGPIVAVDRPDPGPTYPLGGDFGGEMQLVGYDLHPQPRSGEPLIVTLQWRVLSQPPAERFVYLRLVDARGRIWASADSPPVMGLWPVARWQPGILIEDAHELSIPAGTPPGAYRLEVGLYDPASGQTLPATGQPTGQGGGLLLGEVPVEWQSLQADPALPHATETRLAPDALLVGYTSPLTTATSGDLLPIELAWRESTALTAWLRGINNDWVMFEWRDDSGQRLAEQLDELPLPIDEWGRGALLRSRHEVIVPPTLPTGQYGLWLMLHTSSDPAGDAFQLGSVAVTAPPRDFDLPATATLLPDAALDGGVSLAGYDLTPSPDALDLTLYWQTAAPLTSRYKVFAQLLAPDGRLVAQADGFPAAGQRPTTGWLPGEIITDAHTLPLPPDLTPATYRLITGLYDPLTGQRLSRPAAATDFITITEVELP